MTRILVTVAFVSAASLVAEAEPQTLTPSFVAESPLSITANNGTPKTVRLTVQSWGIVGHAIEEIPLQSFYGARLLSGRLAATIDGQTISHLPGDYWTVKAGTTMQVKVLGQVAVLETTAVEK